MRLWQRLTPLYDAGEAKAIVRLVLEDRFGLTFTDIACGKVEELSVEAAAELESIMRRLEHAEPVQYILGKVSFCGLTLQVSPGVLIPRPETEELVEWIKETAPCLIPSSIPPAPCSILDIGTGSGCIAIALASATADSEVTAWDVSEQALSIARENARQNGVHVTFEHHDILSRQENEQGDTRRWDIVVSNPPYICRKERSSMERNVLEYEPGLALFVPDDDPLKFYEAIASFSMKSLKKGGSLYFEINPAYARDLQKMLREIGYKDIIIREDSYGKQRMAKATKP